jgi:F0F1-type ATP synthase assembly protein I
VAEKNQFIPKKPFMEWVVECTALGFLLPGVTFAGYLLGSLLDKACDTHWIYIPGLILGMVAGFVLLIRQVRRDTRDDGA